MSYRGAGIFAQLGKPLPESAMELPGRWRQQKGAELVPGKPSSGIVLLRNLHFSRVGAASYEDGHHPHVGQNEVLDAERTHELDFESGFFESLTEKPPIKAFSRFNLASREFPLSGEMAASDGSFHDENLTRVIRDHGPGR